MKTASSRWIEITPSQYPWEREALDYVREKLPDGGITIHDLRSGAASIRIRQGLTPVEVANVLGHADSSITLKVYARVFDKRDAAARVRAAQASIPGLGPRA
jgi:integrase